MVNDTHTRRRRYKPYRHSLHDHSIAPSVTPYDDNTTNNSSTNANNNANPNPDNSNNNNNIIIIIIITRSVAAGFGRHGMPRRPLMTQVQHCAKTAQTDHVTLRP